MNPFLFLQIRPEYEAASNEYEAIKNIADVHIEIERICHVPFPDINLDNYSGVILGGGPATISDSPDKKPEYQKYFEPYLFELLKLIVDKDFPFIGLCFGPSAIATACGGVVSKKFPEKVGAYNIELTDEGLKDNLFEGLPGNFKAFAGHKESVEKIPPGATIVATGEQCPVQAFRMGNNVYGFQFHPELDPEGLAVRVNVYKNMGYFKPEEADVIIAMARSETVTVPRKILANFLNKYKNPNFNIT